MPASAIWISPRARAGSTSAMPLYGMWVILIPVRALIDSVSIWLALPWPKLP